jgi:DNA-binding transcriptional LysR family regulator
MPLRHKHRSVMDLRRLKTFATIAEHGTVLRAAQVLHITQPALSRQIAGLEQEVGFELFERIGRRLLLTPRGEQFLKDSRSLLAHARALDERAQALRRGDSGTLRVAASAITTEATFPTFLHRYAALAHDVELILVEEDDPAKHLDLLERGEVQLSVNVVNNIRLDNPRFAYRALPSFHVRAACTPSVEVGRSDSIDIRQLAKHPLLLPNTSFATRSIFDAACRLAGVKPIIRAESRAAHALLALAEARHGIAIIPSILQPNPRTLRALRVTHKQESLQIRLAVLWDTRRALPRHAEAFPGLFAAHIREAFPDNRPVRGKSVPPRRNR